MQDRCSALAGATDNRGKKKVEQAPALAAGCPEVVAQKDDTTQGTAGLETLFHWALTSWTEWALKKQNKKIRFRISNQIFDHQVRWIHDMCP